MTYLSLTTHKFAQTYKIKCMDIAQKVLRNISNSPTSVCKKYKKQVCKKSNTNCQIGCGWGVKGASSWRFCTPQPHVLISILSRLGYGPNRGIVKSAQKNLENASL